MEELKNFLFHTDANLKMNNEMKCNICNHYLSVPPIFFNNLIGNICGRCEESDDVIETKNIKGKNSVMERQRVFESIAKFLIFPCSYRINGCDVELKWEEVETHERYCAFKKIVCFLSDKEFLEEDHEPCMWNGEITEFTNHLTKKHNLFSTNNLRLVLGLEVSSIFGPLFGTDCIIYEPKFQSKFYFTEAFGSIVIIMLFYHKRINRYFVEVFTDLSNYKCEKLHYQIEVFDDNKKNSIVLPMTSIQTLRNNFLKKYNGNSLEIDLNYINKLLKMPHFISLDFRIFRENVLVMKPSSKAMSVPLYNEKQLEMMKCIICKIYLTQPIHVCSNGHNICGTCAAQQAECSNCGTKLCTGRNYALEKFMLLANCPCKNKSRGCPVIARTPQISHHELMCRFKCEDNQQCHFSTCSWNGKKLEWHLINSHSHLSLENNKLYPLENQNSCLRFNDNLFTLEMEITADHLKYKLLSCCSEVKYRYDLLLVDSRVDPEMRSNLTISQICQPGYICQNYEFSDMYVPFDLFRELFPTSPNIMFKVNIFLINDSAN